eukprot:TRINITY_DN4304_c0_g1_i1.p1 TRINITY_DN4304_c0_g1~~TRINITY_DN4304_c0_g1_i1.p1  ORF type:complete len:361 (-),score=63.75 TRINITY_DN4304_c0_g1_i1:415-1497(-)
MALAATVSLTLSVPLSTRVSGSLSKPGLRNRKDAQRCANLWNSLYCKHDQARLRLVGSGILRSSAAFTKVYRQQGRSECSVQAVTEEAPGTELQVAAFLDGIKWGNTGLIVAIAQHAGTGAILMQGFADREAVAATLSSRRATFFSRSRQCLWTKGETSGNFIHVTDMYLDCDKDSLIYMGIPDGPTCHTGAETCYYTRVESAFEGDAASSASEEAHPNEALTTFYALEATVRKRQAEALAEAAASAAADAAPEGKDPLHMASGSSNGTPAPKKKPSWTRRLLADPTLLCSKIREEAGELCQTLEASEGKERAASEMADVLYHALVLLAVQDVKLEDVAGVLRARFSKSGIEEKAGRRKA